ncbi:uncharacterized protein LOC124644411 [Helicoverpa zea]|uniref:uncharacterized protein LOC124644411 n=1 Tax=Helicoverpa zea TaxID=7113 RepID=UPI001F5618C7|nr:uncharacterized protein LOC124644411 [Helicoverpa zea]
MANVQRTPPKTTKSQNTNLSQSQTQSEPDINSALMMSDYVNTNRNNKRPRQDNSPRSSQESHINPEQRKDNQSDTITKLLRDQTEIISKLSTDIGEIKTQNSQIHSSNVELRKSNEEIVKSMVFINKQFEDLKKEVEDLRKERQEQKQYIEQLESKVLDLQYKSRSSGIEIRNIPLLSKESSASLLNTVCSIGETVGIDISETEVRDIYRIPGKPSAHDTIRPIIAEFSSVQKKEVFVSAVRSFNKNKNKDEKLNTSIIGIPGESQPVYVAEHLPPNTKKLFYMARNFAKNNAYKYCWISNGNIFLRKLEGDKQILIRTEKCLNDVKNLQI